MPASPKPRPPRENLCSASSADGAARVGNIRLSKNMTAYTDLTDTGTAVSESRDLHRVIAASVAGSAMEWYDFSIYGTASALIFPDLVFPGLDKTAGLLAIFGTYAAGFFARPFGGLFFGWLGDKLGRKVVLVATVLLMGISTLLVGLLPT